jgi:hypothetical protein
MTASSRAPFRFLRYPALACLLVLSAWISGPFLSSQAGVTIGGYQLVSEQTQKGSTVRSTYRATLTNGGAIDQTAQLDGSASSDQDGTPLTYLWTLTSIPAGSHATLSDAAAVKPTFLEKARTRCVG